METIKKLLVNVNILAMGKPFYFLCDSLDYAENDLVVCETTRGIELGKVVSSPKEKEILETDEYPKVIRKGDQRDYEVYNINIERGKEAALKVQEESDKLNLNMKIVSSDFTLDNTKLIICFLSEARVDFRDLLKVLANEFKCRIELRQIGTRDKSKMIGGIGICGLKLCCSTFLNEFDGISITMAKNQMLALNIPKLSGHCGKLICCLKYENDVYAELQKELPRIGTRVKHEDQIYKITSMNVITKMIRLENKDNVVTLPYEQIKDHLLPKDYPMNQNYIVESKPQVEQKVVVEEKVEPIKEEIKEEVSPKENNFNNKPNNNKRPFNNNHNQNQNNNKRNFVNNKKKPFNNNRRFNNNDSHNQNVGDKKDAKN